MARPYRSTFRKSLGFGAVIGAALIVPVVDGAATSTYKLARMDQSAAPIVAGQPTVKVREPGKSVVVILASNNLNYIPDHLGFQPSARNWGWWRLLTDALVGAVFVRTLIVYRRRRRAGPAMATGHA